MRAPRHRRWTNLRPRRWSRSVDGPVLGSGLGGPTVHYLSEGGPEKNRTSLHGAIRIALAKMAASIHISVVSVGHGQHRGRPAWRGSRRHPRDHPGDRARRGTSEVVTDTYTNLMGASGGETGSRGDCRRRSHWLRPHRRTAERRSATDSATGWATKAARSGSACGPSTSPAAPATGATARRRSKRSSSSTSESTGCAYCRVSFIGPASSASRSPSWPRKCCRSPRRGPGRKSILTRPRKSSP